MRTLARLRRNMNMLVWQAGLIEKQERLIDDQNHLIRSMTLNHARDMQSVVAAWLIHIEQPELDMRDALVDFDADLVNRIAVLEEHVVT